MIINIYNLPSYQLTIKIYNQYNTLIQIINPINNCINLNNLKNEIYKIYIFMGTNVLDKFIIFNKNEKINYYYNQNNKEKNTFNLYDYYYFGLKIERGNLLLKSII